MQDSKICFRIYPEFLTEDIYEYREGGPTGSFYALPIGWSFTIICRVLQKIIKERIDESEECGDDDDIRFMEGEYQRLISDELSKNFYFEGYNKNDSYNLHQKYKAVIMRLFENMYSLDSPYSKPLIMLNAFMKFIETKLMNPHLDKAKKKKALVQFCARNSYALNGGEKYFSQISTDEEAEELLPQFRDYYTVKTYKLWKKKVIKILQSDFDTNEMLINNGHSLQNLDDALAVLRDSSEASNNIKLMNLVDIRKSRSRYLLAQISEYEKKKKRKPKGSLSSTIYTFDYLIDYLLVATYEIIDCNRKIKKCGKCKRIFVPMRKDGEYCSFRCNKETLNMTCKEHAAYDNRNEKKKKEEILLRVHEKVRKNLYHNKGDDVSKQNMYDSYIDVSAILRREIRKRALSHDLYERAEIAYLMWSTELYQQKYHGSKRLDIFKEHIPILRLSSIYPVIVTINKQGYHLVFIEILSDLSDIEKNKIKSSIDILVSESRFDERIRSSLYPHNAMASSSPSASDTL